MFIIKNWSVRLITTVNQTWEISIIGLSLAIFTLINTCTKSDKQKSDLLFSLWLIVLSIPLLLVAFKHLGFTSNLLGQYTNPSISLLQGPILYLYVNMLIKKQPNEFQFSALIHLVPFLFFYLLFYTTPKPLPVFSMLEHAHSMHKSADIIECSRIILRHFGSISMLILIFYSVITITSLIRHQKKVTAYFSQKDYRITLHWIYLFPSIFLILLLVNIINENPIWRIPPIDSLTLHLLSYLSSIIFLSFFGVKQKPIFELKEPITAITTTDMQVEDNSLPTFIATPDVDKKQRHYLNEPTAPITTTDMQVEDNTPPTSVATTDVDKKQHHYLNEPTAPITTTDMQVEDNAPPTFAATPDVDKKQSHNLDEQKRLEITAQMQCYMENEKPYLDAEFSVYQLAQALNIPRRTLSHVLNSELNKNFFQYVNEYRIKEVKTYLEDREDKSTILELALKSGFNSKSSFNSLFKKYSAITPSQYRALKKKQ